MLTDFLNFFTVGNNNKLSTFLPPDDDDDDNNNNNDGSDDAQLQISMIPRIPISP